MPTTSVIVPVYNVEKYLPRCIDSILAQTFTDFELILVDDGSPDRCGEICDEYAEKDARIHVIHQPNGGLSAARNAGLDISSGDFIFFVDSDDSVRNDLLETTMRAFRLGADLVSFQLKFIYSDGETRETQFAPRVIRIDGDGERLSFITAELLQYRIGWEACTRAFRKSIIDEHRLRFVDNRKVFAEDMYFSICYCAFTSEIAVLPDCLYNYYLRDTSIMGVQKTELNVDRMNELCKELLTFFENTTALELLVSHFPAIGYFVLNNVISRYRQTYSLSIFDMRESILKDVSDWGFFQWQMRGINKERAILYGAYQDSRTVEEIINICQYYADGNRDLYYFKRYCASVLNRIGVLKRLYQIRLEKRI